MPTMYCALCGRSVEARRQIGVGTVVLAVVTAGISLLAIPFYAKRCSICKSAAVSLTNPDSASIGRGSSPPGRLADMEKRLSLTEGELERASAELDRLRTERDFYRQLLGDPTLRAKNRPTNE
jgi:hypothetical protein